MLIGIVNDLHCGARNAHQVFENELRNFLSDQLLPILKSKKIKVLFIAGDVFDDRVNINVRSLNLIRKFFEKLEEMKINTFIIPGNHDTYYKSSIRPNSIEPMVSGLRHIKLLMEPTDVTIDGTQFLFIPWICRENENSCLKEIQDTEAEYLVCHADIQGSQYVPGVISDHGYPTDIFRKFKRVFNGHIHTRDYFQNIVNLGTQYQWSWGDHGLQKGFHLFETKTDELVFVPNENVIFDKFYYDEDLIEGEDPLKWIERNSHRLTKKYIKFIVSNRQDAYLFDRVMEQLNSLDLHSVEIIDNSFSDFLKDEEFDEETFKESKTTIQIISDTVKEIKTKLNKDQVMRLISQLHTEALNRDIIKEN